ncbi:glycosyltransferase [Nostoc sp. CHAB 5834]|nr:glycosyltransferase [Nostoc sp. CHAB 5834]
MTDYSLLLSAYSCAPGHGSEPGNGWSYASLLSQRGFKVYCLTRNVHRNTIEDQTGITPFPNLSFHYVSLPAWVDKAYYKGPIGLYFHYLYWQWAAYKVANKLKQKNTFALVHHVTFSSLQLGTFMYKLRIPFVLGPLGGGQEALSSLKKYFKSNWRKERIRSLLSKVLLRFNPACYKSVQSADYLLISNQDTYKLANSIRGDKTIHRMLDAGLGSTFGAIKYRPRPISKVFNLLWVGRLMPRKGLELTLHALSYVDKAVPVMLTIVGDGEMGVFVNDYIEEYELSARVKWVGRVPHSEVQNYYQQADAFFFTSLRDSCPGQILEAMINSLPVITLNLHGQAELVNESTGITVLPTTPEKTARELAKAIEWLYHHPSEYNCMSSNAYNFAKSQLWTAKIDFLVEKFYMPILQKK